MDGTDTDDEWTRVTAPRADESREWEVFCRAPDERLRHVGSVSAPSAAVAHEQATTLVGHATDDLWLCPADEVCRYTTEPLG